MKWDLFAHERDGKFYHVGSEFYVGLHSNSNVPIPVTLEECEDGEYWGWIYKHETIPSMIWPNEAQFSICFPYGYKKAESVGDGRHVRLKIIKSVHNQG